MTVGHEAKLTLVPTYLKASTPELLRESMLMNNLRLNQWVQYQDIRQLNDGSFICWYYEDIDLWAKTKPKKAKS